MAAITIRIDNLSAGSITVSVTCDIGSHHFALWSAKSVPAGWSLIVAQTGLENFDGCDPNMCITMVSHTIPVVHVTVNGVTASYSDNDQILNTNGVDAAGCPYTG